MASINDDHPDLADLLDQMIEQTLKQAESSDLFDVAALKQLAALRKGDGFQKFERIVSALRDSAVASHETAQING